MGIINSLQAVLLVGGTIKDLPENEPKVPSKGYIDVGGKPMAARTLAAMVQAQTISRITLVTPLHGKPLDENWTGVDQTAPALDTLSDSLFSGLDKVGTGEDPVIVVAGDLPFITAEALDDFAARCHKRQDASMWYCYLSQINSQAKYPDLPHTWANMNGTKYCGGGLIAIRPSVTSIVKEAVGAITGGRKRVAAMAKTMGFMTLLRLVCGRLKVSQAEAAMSRLMRVPCAAIESPFAETAFNVDDYESLLLARKYANLADQTADSVH